MSDSNTQGAKPKPAKETYNITTKEGRRRIEARYKVLKEKHARGYGFSRQEEKQFEEFKVLVETWEKQKQKKKDEAKQSLLQAGTDAAALKAKLQALKQEQDADKPGETQPQGAAGGGPPNPQPPASAPASPTGTSRPTTPIQQPQSLPPSQPPSDPSSSPSDSDDDSDDDMPGKPTGQEINSIPLFTGTDGTDPEIWLEHVIRAATAFDWQENARASAACLRLTEKAAV